MYLNHQFIKILEDLGISDQTFLNLQNSAVQNIKLMTKSPINAANFIEDNRCGTAAGIPSFIRLLSDIKLDFSFDGFLRLCVDIVAVTKLREIKYKARIPVENAYLLFGVIDETNTLQPGEIFVSVRGKDDITYIVTGTATITRAPAMHPGDIQIVRAVDVPDGNPLKALHNCVVFSQKGERDLPSQLGGGDLDGDQYYVIFDPDLRPSQTHEAADYPRLPPVDIGRPVSSYDMTQFFLKFMETDMLGYICNTHLQIADQMSNGVFNELCIGLAEMASTAVDYSKTGIPVSYSHQIDIVVMLRCIGRVKQVTKCKRI